MRGRALLAGLLIAGFALWASPAGAKPPKSCIAALDAAEQVVQLNAEESKNVADYFAVISASATRNATGGITGVTTYLNEATAATKDLTAKTNDLTARVRVAVAAYNAAAAKCRKS